MTSRHPDIERSTGTDYESLAARFRPLFVWRVGQGPNHGSK
jgi:hypothetical protein